jgi:hypothetical protein
MRIDSRWHVWTAAIGLGAAFGWSLHCQTPSTHVQVRMGEDCASCHQSDFQKASQPLHVGVLSETCADCHSNTSWSPARGSNHSWPLDGAHAAAPCNTCHQGDRAVYEGTPQDCVSCHGGQRDQVLQPSHADFSDDCASCHGTAAWKPATFAHSWPLEGVHASTDCSSCHLGDPPTYDGTPTTCSSCHQADLATVTEPPHDGFSQDCSTCHGTASWDSASFEHTGQFPLTGSHQTTECTACHTGSPAVFAGTASECVGCHRQDFDQSPFPGHAAFATTCQDCHSTSGWVPASGGNHPQNLFSITGDHNYPCNDCHNPSLGPNGAGNADCVGCHDGEHTLARMDAEHAGEVRNYPTGANRAPNFCLQCHADGRE